MHDQDQTWLDEIEWNDEGLVPVVAQEKGSGVLLNLAWMNREALAMSIREGRAVYWSRSRQKLWRKGEESGHVQLLNEVRVDCDKDTILLIVTQQGGIACHTGRHSCFYHRLQDNGWQIVEQVLRDPGDIYKQQ